MTERKPKLYLPYIFCGYASLFALGLLDNARGPYYADVAGDLALPDSKASFLFVMASLMAFVMGMVSHPFIQRFNLLNLIRVGHLTMAAGFLALSYMTDFITLILATSLFGVGFGLINVGQNILIFDGAPLQMRRKFISGLHSIYALASILGPLIISIFFSYGLTWRQGFAWFGLVPLFAFFLTYTAKNQVGEEGHDSNARDDMSWRKSLAGASLGFYVLAEILLSSRLVVYLRREEGMEPDVAAQVLALFFILVLAGRILFTVLDVHRFKSRQIMLVCLVFSFVTNILGLVFSPYWLVLCGLCMAPMFGVGVTYMSELSPKNPSRGIANALSLNAIMIVMMHFGVGYVTQAYGIQAAMMSGPAFLLISWLILKLEPWKHHA